VFLCPKVKVTPDWYNTIFHYGTYSVNTLWGLNYQITKCPWPAKCHLLGDGAGPGHYYYKTYALDFRHWARFESQAQYQGIHDGPYSIANVVMVDGHVESKRYCGLHVNNPEHA